MKCLVYETPLGIKQIPLITAAAIMISEITVTSRCTRKSLVHRFQLCKEVMAGSFNNVGVAQSNLLAWKCLVTARVRPGNVSLLLRAQTSPEAHSHYCSSNIDFRNYRHFSMYQKMIGTQVPAL